VPQPKLVAEFAKGLRCCNDVRPQVLVLEQLAAVAPQYAPAVAELKSKLEYLQTLCELGREITAPDESA
jgi:hypothetical protein